MSSTAHSLPRLGEAQNEQGRTPSTLTELLNLLPRLHNDKVGRVDFAASDRVLLTRLEHNADLAGRVVVRGMAAVGLLMAYAAPAIEEGSVGVDEMEALGLFMAEVGLLAASLQTLRGQCGQAVTD